MDDDSVFNVNVGSSNEYVSVNGAEYALLPPEAARNLAVQLIEQAAAVENND